MIRRWLVICLALLALAATRSSAQSVIVGVGGDLSAAVGSDISAPIFADMRSSGGHRLGSYTVRLAWDKNVLSLVGVEAGAFAQPQVQGDSASFGIVYAAAVSVSGSVGVVDLLHLKFRALTAATSTVSVQVKELSAAVTFTDLLGLVATVNSTFCGAIGRWGDLDGDSLANSRDALAILSSVLGLTVAPQFVISRGDVNGDTKVNTVDALIILSYAVGLQIPGQRVLLSIPGGCGSISQTTLTVLPDTADVVMAQRVPLKVMAVKPSGVQVSVAVNWTVLDPSVAVVDQNGLLVGRQAGTTRAVAALGPGIQYSVPVVVRARRGTWFVSAPLAKRASIQMGTLKWPFSTPQRAFPLAAEGDTIRVLPGVHDYEYAYEESFDYLDFTEELRVGVVMIGDTLPDGTRPVLRSPNLENMAVDWVGGQRGEIRDLVFRNFYYAAEVEGLANLTLRNVRIESLNAVSGYGLYVQGVIDTLRILGSDFQGDAYSGYEGVYVESGAKLVQIQNSVFSNWGGSGFQGYDVDSLDVQGSEFSHNNQYGVRLETSSRPSVAARISRSRFLDNNSDAINIENGRRVALDHNYFRITQNDGLNLTGPGFIVGVGPLGRPVQQAPAAAGYQGVFTSQADSIKFRSDDYNWIYAQAFDSIRIDSMWVESPADTAIYQYGSLYANYASVTRSKFLNLYYSGFEFQGRRLLVDNSTFTGCAADGCGWDYGTAIEAHADNDSGPAVTLTNSTFSGIAKGLYVPNTGDSAGPIVVTNNTADSMNAFLDVRADSVVVTDNLLTKMQSYGIRAGAALSRPYRQAYILRNRMTCQAGEGGVGIEVDDMPAIIEDNVARDCLTAGIYAYSSGGTLPLDLLIRRDSVASDPCCGSGISIGGNWRPTVYGSRIVGFYNGLVLSLTDTGTAVIDSNAVSGAGYSGVYIPSATSTMTGRRNRIANNTGYGIFNDYHLTGSRSFTDGAITGNGTAGIYNNAPVTLIATDNWWGDAGGPGVGGANDVTGPVTTSGFKTSDPVGTVPPMTSPPIAAGAPRAMPLSSSPSRPAADSPIRSPSVRNAAKAARHAEWEAARKADAERVARAIAERRAVNEAQRRSN